MFDVAVIGAGIAGLTCAQQLHQAGYKVVVVEKSRGVGGRVATRRVGDTRADHGLRYLEATGERLQQLVEKLTERNIVQVWYESESKIPRYVASQGMSAIAKFLATHLEIKLNQRVQAITPSTDKTWQLHFEAANTTDLPAALTAKAIVIAIPAPQALILLKPLGETTLSEKFLESLGSVEFDPCLSVIASYPNSQPLKLDWKSLDFAADSDLAWIGLDSSKRINAQSPVFVIQSSAEFARGNLNSEDLHPAGHHLLSRAAAELTLPWLNSPDWFQVHRWRYAFSSRFLPETYLDAKTPQPLICCGDWCGGNLIESALHSGYSAAIQINLSLKNLPLPGRTFLDFLEKDNS